MSVVGGEVQSGVSVVFNLPLPDLSDSSPLSVTSKVGNQAVLPCSWKSHLEDKAPPLCHVQWTAPVDIVFEQRGQQRWQAEGLKDRVEVPEEKLQTGDCSLIISDVQIGDTGRYESFMVVGGAQKRRVFIQSVKLSVFGQLGGSSGGGFCGPWPDRVWFSSSDHKSSLTGAPGEDLVLELYTPRSRRVVFQGR